MMQQNMIPNQNLSDLIERQLKPQNIFSPEVLSAFAAVDRQCFVPNAWRPFAYAEMRIPLDCDEWMLSPVEAGLMVQALSPSYGGHILEIGTGSGYTTAILAKLFQKVTTIDIVPSFISSAHNLTSQMGLDQIDYLHGNGFKLNMAPQTFDAVLVTGGIPEWGNFWRDQVKPGGIMIAAVGDSSHMHVQLMTKLSSGHWHQTPLFETQLPYLKHIVVKNSFVF